MGMRNCTSASLISSMSCWYQKVVLFHLFHICGFASLHLNTLNDLLTPQCIRTLVFAEFLDLKSLLILLLFYS